MSLALNFRSDCLPYLLQLRPRCLVIWFAKYGLDARWQLYAQVRLAPMALDHGSENLKIALPLWSAPLVLLMLCAPICHMTCVVVNFQKRSCWWKNAALETRKIEKTSQTSTRPTNTHYSCSTCAIHRLISFVRTSEANRTARFQQDGFVMS